MPQLRRTDRSERAVVGRRMLGSVRCLKANACFRFDSSFVTPENRDYVSGSALAAGFVTRPAASAKSLTRRSCSVEVLRFEQRLNTRPIWVVPGADHHAFGFDMQRGRVVAVLASQSHQFVQ